MAVQEKDSHAGTKSDGSETVFIVLCFAMTIVVGSFLYTYSVRKESQTSIEDVESTLHRDLASHKQAVDQRTARTTSDAFRKELVSGVLEQVDDKIENVNTRVGELQLAGGSVEEHTQQLEGLTGRLEALQKSLDDLQSGHDKAVADLAKKIADGDSAVLKEAEKTSKAGDEQQAARQRDLEKGLADVKKSQGALGEQLGQVNALVTELKDAVAAIREAHQKSAAELAQKIEAGDKASADKAKAAEEKAAAAARPIEELTKKIDDIAGRLEKLEKAGGGGE